MATPLGARSVSFALTDDQKAYQKLARDFVANEVIPKAKELDQTMAYPEELFRKVRQFTVTTAQRFASTTTLPETMFTVPMRETRAALSFGWGGKCGV